MAAYTTITKVRELLPLVTDSIVPDANVTNFITYAEGEVNAILRGYGFETPVSSPSGLVQELAMYIAARSTIISAGISEQSTLKEEFCAFIIDRIEEIKVNIKGVKESRISDTVEMGQKGLEDTDYSNFTTTDVPIDVWEDDS